MYTKCNTASEWDVDTEHRMCESWREMKQAYSSVLVPNSGFHPLI